MKQEEIIVICAVRYALGRMTYVVGEVCNYVTIKKNELSQYCINIIIQDIEEELKRCHEFGQTLGMECDEKCWTRLLEVLNTGTNNDQNEVEYDPDSFK